MKIVKTNSNIGDHLKHLALALSLGAALFLGTGQVMAQAGIQYTGPANGAWNDGANWAGGVVPTGTAQPLIDIAGPVISASDTVSINGGFYIGISNGPGSVTQTGGSLTVNNMEPGYGSHQGTYTLSGGTLNLVQSGWTLLLGRNGSGTFNLEGGTLNSGQIWMGFSGGTGVFNMTGGTLNSSYAGSAFQYTQGQVNFGGGDMYLKGDQTTIDTNAWFHKTGAGTYTATYDAPTDTTHLYYIPALPSSEKDILSFTFPSYGSATIEGTDISITLPLGTNVTALKPTYSVSSGATCIPASGSTQDFTDPVHYIVTAADNSSKEYTVTVTVFTFPETWGEYDYKQYLYGGSGNLVLSSQSSTGFTALVAANDVDALDNSTGVKTPDTVIETAGRPTVYQEFPAVDLSVIGQKITATFDLKFNNALVANDQTFRFGLGNPDNNSAFYIKMDSGEGGGDILGFRSDSTTTGTDGLTLKSATFDPAGNLANAVNLNAPSVGPNDGFVSGFYSHFCNSGGWFGNAYPPNIGGNYPNNVGLGMAATLHIVHTITLSMERVAGGLKIAASWGNSAGTEVRTSTYSTPYIDATVAALGHGSLAKIGYLGFCMSKDDLFGLGATGGSYTVSNFSLDYHVPPVVTTSYSTSGFTVDTNQDLILGDTPSWSGTVGSTNMASLADGQAPLAIPGYDGNNTLQNGVVVTWDLGAAATINEIQTYSAWPGDRYVQDYTVDVSLDGTTWTNGVVAVVAQGTGTLGGWNNVKVSVTNSDNSPLAASARYVRFNFNNQQNGAVAYTEMVVNGVSLVSPAAPAFTTHPQSQTIINNQNVTFTAAVTGYPAPTIAWHFIDSSSVDHLLATTGDTLTFQVNATKAGSYYAVATNTQGTATSDSALLTVTPTAFTETVDNSGNAFAGMGTNNLIAGNAGTSVALGNYDTQGGWTTANLTDGDIGSPTSVSGGSGAYPYSLIRSNGTITYNLAAPCNITGFESWSSWNGGGRCNQNYTFSYSLDGINYTQLWTVANNPSQVFGNAVALAITTPLVNVVSVRFDFGTQQNDGVAYTELAVYGTVIEAPPTAPTFVTIPQSQSVTNDATVTFTATATGSPAPTIAWHFVDAASTDHLLATTGNTLTFNADLTKAGSYYAVASNTGGSATSSESPAVLTVAPNAVATSGGITETDLTFSTSSQSFMPMAANNLIAGNAGTNVALNIVETNGGWTPANLTDGNINAPGSIGNGNGVYSIIGDNGTITYNLGSGANGAGYDITGVRTLTSWPGGGRVQPKYTVSYSLDGTTFTPMATVNYLAPDYQTPTNSWGTDVELAIAGISHVKSIKFTFGSPQQNNGVTYTELAVFGASSTAPFVDWANGSFANGATLSDKTTNGNPDSDSLSNLQEFAFGTDPTVSTSGSITYASGVVTGHGLPTTQITHITNGVDFRAVFGRRKDYVSAGLTYTVQFSAGLDAWVTSAVEPTVLASDSTMDAVSVPYPLFITTANGVEKPTFFRVGVNGSNTPNQQP